MKKIFTHVMKHAYTVRILLLLVLVQLAGTAGAQVSLSTTAAFTNDDTAAAVTFNFQNTNSYPVIITGIEGILNAFGTNNVEIWYKPSAINGLPGAISTGNGWTMASGVNVTGIANATNNTTQPLFSSLSLSVPAGATYGLAIIAANGQGGTLRLDGSVAATTISGGGCNLFTGPNIGYAGYGMAPISPTAGAKGWLGKITFIPGMNCSGTPAAPVASGPAAVCANALFSLTASGYSLGPGIGHQWQYYNTTTNTWTDITGATTPSFYTNTAGITAATQYRLRTSCSFTGTQSLSNVITVGIGSGLAGGTYTVDNNAPSTSTNFISMSAAAAALKCGVTGAVTFNVAPGSGPYTEQVIFPHIPGTSPVNKVRFNGNGATVQYESTAMDIGVINIEGADYLTLDSFTIKSLGQAYGYGVLLTDSIRYDSITHCFIDMSSIGNGSTYASAGIAISDYYYNANNDSSSVSYCYIGHNHIYGSNNGGGAQFGIRLGDNYYNGLNNDVDTGNIIAYNEIENFSHYGIYGHSSMGTQILYNDIHRKNRLVQSNFFGIHIWGGNYNTAATENNLRIIGNRIHDPASPSATGNNVAVFWGIYVNSDWYYLNNNSQQRVLIANNALYNIRSAGSSIYGIGVYSGNYNNAQDEHYIYHNTVSIDLPSDGTGDVYGLWVSDYYNSNSLNSVFFKNNLVTIRGGTAGDKYGFYYTDLNNNNTVQAQRNNIYVNSSQPGPQYYGSYMNTAYSTMAAFQAAFPALEVGSLSVDPQYTSAATGDLTPQNFALYGNGENLLTAVSTDILGRPRSAAPTPGAFEIGSDAGVSALVAPLGTYCSSVKEVRVSIINAGLTPINTVQVNWSLNNVLQPPVTYTGLLGPSNTTVITLGNGLFLPNTPVTIKAWTSMPNGQGDAFPYNDTLVVTTQSSTSVPVDLGPDATICTGNTYTLDAGYPGAIHVWDNNTSAQTRTVMNAGTYYVRVTALDGCIGVDTFILTLRPLPVVDLGPDQEICLYEPTTLDAGNPGATYLWDDGSTGQTRTVDSAGYFEVQVTDQYGCTGVDNIEVILKDIPTVDGINATHADSGTYSFYPINPMYALSYTWNFGDGSPEATGYFVQHTYTAKGIYTVSLSMVGECTGLVVNTSRTVDVFSVYGESTGIGNTSPADGLFSLYPNPAREELMIRNESAEKMQRFKVYNILGQVIMDRAADNNKLLRLELNAMASGMYTIRIETDKGFVIRKFEVQR